MRIRHHLLFIAVCLVGYAVTAQSLPGKRIFLRNASFVPAPLSQRQLSDTWNDISPIDGKRFAIIQFDRKPLPAQQRLLAEHGLILLNYLPPDAYIASISQPQDQAFLKQAGVMAVSSILTHYKVLPQLLVAGQSKDMDVSLIFYPFVPTDSVTYHLQNNGYSIKKSSLSHYGLLVVTVPAGRMYELASLPFVAGIEPVPPEPTLLNENSRNISMANVVQSALPGGYNLTGAGISVGISELPNSIPYPHEDFGKRIILGPVSLTAEPHATHVLGTIAGAGNINPRYKGYAPSANMLTSNSPFTEQLSPDMATIINNYGLVAANYSYATGVHCIISYFGNDVAYDRPPLDFPGFLDVYAVGNSGDINCSAEPVFYSPYSSGYNTVLNNGNSAKNVLSVGALDTNGVLHHGSSRGPAIGGRIKPEVTALGFNVTSTVYGTSYASAGGTSMAAPGVTGGLTLMNEYYRRLHNGVPPTGSLMKAVMCNSATDLGNRGPDFLYGYGSMNLLRAIRTLEHGWHTEDSIADQQQKTFPITVPAGVAQLKVMLYWHDAPSAPLAAKPLINDLDMMVTGGNGQQVLPYVLNSDPLHTSDPATRGVDRANNAEQVVIDDPVPGNYTVKINGADIGQGPLQGYSLVYDLIEDNVELTHPSGGEAFKPGETVLIHWYDQDHNTSTYTIDYSVDNGVSWTVINANIPATQRRFKWNVPDLSTGTAKIRISRNNREIADVSAAFTILGTPVVTLSPVQCPSYLGIKWEAVPAATDYEIFLLRNGVMSPIGYTTTTDYVIDNLSADSLYYVAVRGRVSGAPGLRSVAISRKPDNGNCAGAISDGDLRLEAILLSSVARKWTSGSYQAEQQIRVRIRNLDDQASGSFSVHYAVDNNGWVSENFGDALPAGGFKDITLAAPYDFSAAGTYRLRAVVTANADQYHANDTAVLLMRHLDNAPVTIAPVFIDSFPLSEKKIYTSDAPGLSGAERYDYSSETDAGRLNAGAAGLFASERKELYLLSATSPVNTGKYHRITGTFNLQAYDTTGHDVGLQVTFSKTGSTIGNERIYVRGSDSEPWAEAIVFSPVTGPSINNKTTSVNLGQILRNAKQNYSSSFQIMLEQRVSAARFSVSKITLFNARNDVELVSIDSLRIRSCNLPPAPLRIRVRNNSANAINDLALAFSINDGPPVTERITSIAASATVTYIFNAPVHYSAFGVQRLKVWVQHPNDSYPENDRKDSLIYHLPLISSFPYLEDFENNNGAWYAEGKNSSWAWGSPASPNINTAASGNKVWKTNLTGNYNNNEQSLLYTPCFDLSRLINPRISISIAHDFDYCASNYYCERFESVLIRQPGVPPFQQSANYNWGTSWAADQSRRWRVGTLGMPADNNTCLRFDFRSDANNNGEGIAIDNVHVYNSVGLIYGGDSNDIKLEKELASSQDWQDFISDGKVIASVNTYGQNLGETAVSNFRHASAPNFHGQYYLRRHFLFNSSNKPSAPVGIRIYFKQQDVDSLYFSKNCPSCKQPRDAFRFGVSTYTTASTQEYNADLQDNLHGSWRFINNGSVRVVPYEDGYYAEFTLNELGEVWLNNGGLDQNSVLPMQFGSFSVARSDKQALLEWSTVSEINIHHFDIEVAKGNQAFGLGLFEKVGELNSKGTSAQPQQYRFVADADQPQGVYYYRIKAVDPFGNYAYTDAKPVMWSGELTWQVFPNPSTNGQVTLTYQSSPARPVKLALFNSNGALLRQWQVSANGFVQQESFSLAQYAGGVYMLRIDTGEKIFSLKVVTAR